MSSVGSPSTPNSKRAYAQTIEWYRDNESWWRPLKDAVEDTYAKRGQ